MNQLNPIKTSYFFAIVIGGLHFCWSLLVATGFAQSLMDFVFRLHMIMPFYLIAPFDIITAVSLVIFTSVLGLIVGYVFANVWNKLHQA